MSFVYVIQPLSTCLRPDSPDYHPHAAAGMIMVYGEHDAIVRDLVRDLTFKVSDEGAQRTFLEWATRNTGGRFLANHGADPSVVEGCFLERGVYFTSRNSEIHEYTTYHSTDGLVLMLKERSSRNFGILEAGQTYRLFTERRSSVSYGAETVWWDLQAEKLERLR